MNRRKIKSKICRCLAMRTISYFGITICILFSVVFNWTTMNDNGINAIDADGINRIDVMIHQTN